MTMDDKNTELFNIADWDAEINSNAVQNDIDANFGAVILAAGYSSRMKAFKPLLPVGDVPAVARIARTLQESGINNILVVTGYCREKLLPIVQELGMAEAYNEHYDKGMFSSIRAGLAKGRALFPQKQAFFLMPVDCPLISSEILQAMMREAAARSSALCRMRDFLVPVYEGKKGHPLMIPSCYIDEVCAYDGPGGLKAITDKYWERMIRILVDEEGCLLDMDTPAGYEEIKGFLKTGGKRQSLEELAAGRRIFLVRHGETQQHGEKMFIGQYDVPLSDYGRKQVADMACRLVAEKPEAARIYTSNLGRARESAEIIADILARKTGGEAHPLHELPMHELLTIEKSPELREINLGKWDGQKISEIIKKYPEEYERRGADLFAFKTGNKSENFYDMQYRAVRALRRILAADNSHDVIIVTHSGVIRALENNIRGLRVDDEWEKLDKGSFRVIAQK